jgi:RNA polymerase sigma-70 factor, ECF subfamily
MRRMHEATGHFPSLLVSVDGADRTLEREFEDQVRECSNLVVRVAFSVVRQREDAEEVAQEAFARAYRQFRDLRDPERFRAWIVRVTWRLAIDRWRSNRRRQTREQVAISGTAQPDVEELAAQAQRSERLWNAIDDLPDKLRIVIVLSALEGHDVHQVARLLAIPEGTVKSRLFLARKALAQRLRCLANDSAKR